MFDSCNLHEQCSRTQGFLWTPRGNSLYFIKCRRDSRMGIREGGAKRCSSLLPRPTLRAQYWPFHGDPIGAHGPPSGHWVPWEPTGLHQSHSGTHRAPWVSMGTSRSQGKKLRLKSPPTRRHVGRFLFTFQQKIQL